MSRRPQRQHWHRSLVGWEWDQSRANSPAIAIRPGAGGREAAHSDGVDNPNSRLLAALDSGRPREHPAPGQPSTVNAVEYRAPSGALVFAPGTMASGPTASTTIRGSTRRPTISSRTWARQPATPEKTLTLDTAGQPARPWRAFTPTPASTTVGTSVTFDASASKWPNGHDHRLQVGPGQQRNIATTPALRRR